ncbi:MAG: dihydroorotase [Rhodospirillales bacterium]|nr:dihydroorotase [Rhodospirillales bacterium]
MRFPPGVVPSKTPGGRGGPAVAYVNARIVDPAAGTVAAGGMVVRDGLVADIGAHLAKAAALSAAGPHGMETIDCGGKCLAPGLIDMRVQIREPGEEHKETISTASEAAAAGGVTTMVALPNTRPVIDDAALVESVARLARETSLVRVHTYAAVTRGLNGKEMTEFGLLAAAGALGFTDATHATVDAQLMRRALSYAKAFGLPLIQHPEEPQLARGAMNEGELSTRLGIPGIPAAAEIIQIERDIRLAELTGGRLHIAHVSTAEGVAAIRAAKRRGVRITCDTAPHYFALNELALTDYRTFAKVSPPLRGETDRRAVVEGLADGTIDAVASDHSPHDQDSKRLPLAQAAFGTVGLETLLPVLLELVHNASLSLPAALALVTSRPAALLGLKEGRLAKGAAADFVVFDPDAPWKVDAKKLRSKSKNSAFDGRLVQGRVHRTVAAGIPVHLEGG